ncbi:MAG: hypothetical protein PHQ00_06880 [Phycisphaerae bacterium]|nr:hypothetical protein [Phycisphaerae bacterium]
MAGMFYTLQEVIEKLGKTEAEIKTFVREGKLREFRDGTKQLYKIEDVDALAGAAKNGSAVLSDSLEITLDETGDVSLAPEELDVLMGSEEKKNNDQESNFQLDETGELMAEETLGGTPKAKKTDDDILLSPAADGTSAVSDSISIAGDSVKQDSSLTEEDTKISAGGDSINVLGESDTDFKVTDDTSSDTKIAPEKPKGNGRLDNDVNLDAGGSGSGLLDLSLQADDTSLGAVLDDIYPESQGTPLAAEPSPMSEEAESAEPEDMLEQPEGVGIPEDVIPHQEAAPAAQPVVVMAAELPADASSNIFGFILFVPLIVFIYTSIVIVASYKPISNLPILSALGPMIWYVAGGLAAVVVLMVLIGSLSGRPKKPKAPKEPKAKKAKPKKEKKAKKGKEQPSTEA